MMFSRFDRKIKVAVCAVFEGVCVYAQKIQMRELGDGVYMRRRNRYIQILYVQHKNTTKIELKIKSPNEN